MCIRDSPYALRRQALGIINILISSNYHMPLIKILAGALYLLNIKPEDTGKLIPQILEFFKLRLKNMMIEQGIRYDVVDAVFADERNDDLVAVSYTHLNDELLRVIKEHYESVIVARGNVIVFSGEDNEVGQIETLFKELLFLYRQGMPLTTHDVRYSIGMIAEGRLESLHRMYADTIIVTNRGRQVKMCIRDRANSVHCFQMFGMH